MLWLFLVILYIMHVRWSWILLYKTSELVCDKKRISDDINYNKLIKDGNKAKSKTN